VVLAANIGFDLVKDLDFEFASLLAWILFGLWWFRPHFQADSDPASVRWGLAARAGGIALAIVYAVFGTVVLESQLTPETGPAQVIESMLEALIGNPTRYQALTERASWFVDTLPVVSYALVLLALLTLLRPVLAPRAAATDRERVHQLLKVWGRNHISHLAVHGAESYHWFDDEGCIAFSLKGRTALALGDPICPPALAKRGLEDFVAYCERQDWIPAFYQVDTEREYRDLGFVLVPIGSEALIQTSTFELTSKERRELRYSVKRCEKEGVRFGFVSGPDALAEHSRELHEVSGTWLQRRRGPELSYSLGTLSTLADADITVGLAFAAGGGLEAFVSWLPGACPQRMDAGPHAPAAGQRLRCDGVPHRSLDRRSSSSRHRRGEPGRSAARDRYRGYIGCNGSRAPNHVLGPRSVPAEPDPLPLQGQVQPLLGGSLPRDAGRLDAA